MVVLLYAAEIEILNEREAPDRDQLLAEAALAYRARGQTLKANGRLKDAQVDEKRAAALEARARKLAGKKDGKASASAKKPAPPANAAQITLVNTWTQPVTVVVNGVAHRLRAGEHKTIRRPAGPFTYEVQVLHHWGKGTLADGETCTIRIHPGRQ